MRDLSRASGMSLAGLYYYFESKERLLFLIQKHTFTTIVQRLKARLEGVNDPEQQIRVFILNHLDYFLAKPAAMKVLSHEAEALKNGFASEVAAIKREYYRICVGLLDELKRDLGLQFSTRIAVLSLFGMMNWIYTWHNPRVDADAEHIAREMGDVFLRGVMNGAKGRKTRIEDFVFVPEIVRKKGVTRWPPRCSRQPPKPANSLSTIERTAALP